MPNEVKLLPCPLADELEAIRSGVDAFNPDARLAARSAFDAAEQVWKLVPKIIVALRSRPTTVVTDEVVERVARAIFDDHNRVYSVSQCKWESDPDHWRRYARAALASMPTVVTGEQQEWQPIESAPREEFSSVILIARDGRGNGKRCVMPALFDGECWQSISLVGLLPFVNPIHWQPLPEPPAQPGDA